MQADDTHRNGADGNGGGGEPLNISVPEAAHRLGIGKTKMWQLVHGGEVDSILIGTRRVVPVAALKDYNQRLLDAQRLLEAS
jgi:excisionase family DNA binding protein